MESFTPIALGAYNDTDAVAMSLGDLGYELGVVDPVKGGMKEYDFRSR